MRAIQTSTAQSTGTSIPATPVDELFVDSEEALDETAEVRPFEPFATRDSMELLKKRHGPKAGRSQPDAHVPISQRYADGRSAVDKLSDVVTAVATAPFRLAADGVEVIGDVLLDGLNRGLDAAGVPRLLRKAIMLPLRAIFGLVAGGARVPQSMVATAVTWLRNLASGRWARSGVEAMNLLFQPLAGAVATAATVLLGSVRGIDEALNPSRPLTEGEKRGLSIDYARDLLDKVRVHDGDRSLVFAIAGFAASAQTHYEHVYLRGGSKPPQVNPVMRHELVHSLQYRDLGGLTGFWSDYFGQMAGLALTGRDYYAEIRQEDEAYALQYVKW